MNVKNKTIVVTGGLGLLGKAIIKDLLERGADVICADINVSNNTNSEMHVDISDENSVNELIAKIVKDKNKIDGWVNNAYPRTKDWGEHTVEDLPFESWRKNVDMHLNGYFLCCQKILNQMKLQGSGSVINLASIYGMVAPDFSLYGAFPKGNSVGYSAIKGSIINLTRYLAVYYGKHNVRVNCISPGGIFDNQKEPFLSNYNNKVPLKRMGLPEDIAPSVSFLLSDDSAYITGHNLVVDGGWTAI